MLPLLASAQQEHYVLEEIVITATKRSQSLQDTALSVAAVDSETIDKRGLVGMDDYLRTLPGLNSLDRGAGRNTIIIRGVSTSPQATELPTPTGIYYGETPLTDFGSFGGGNPDIKLVDIDRVEILRGPQGTLYGDGSLGGTVRIIPKAPELNSLHGNVAATYSNTEEKGGDNTMAQGTLNLPLIEDRLALRATAYQYDNSGTYENIAASDPVKSTSLGATLGAVLVDEEDIGSDKYTGGRVSLLWQASDDLSVKASYFTQDIEQDGLPEESLRLKPFQQARFGTSLGSESLEQDINVTNLEVLYELTWGDLFASSSWVDTESLQDRDVGVFFAVPLGGDTPIALEDRQGNDAFIQELRFTSNFDGAFQMLVGAFYQDIDITTTQFAAWAGDPDSDIFGGATLFTSHTEAGLQQQALFGEFSYELSEQLKATFGWRYFDYERDETRITDGVFNGNVRIVSNPENQEDDTTLKLNISYTTDNDQLYYVQVQEGFRLGRPHIAVPSTCDVDNDGLVDSLDTPIPDVIDSDTLISYELGSKFTLMEGRLELRSAAYYISWDDIPVSRNPPCAFLITENAGEAEIKGAEIEGTFLLSSHWIFTFGTAYTDAALAEDTPGLGSSGDTLPGTPGFTVNMGSEYGFNLATYDAYIRADWAYVDEYYNNLKEQGPAAGDYHQLDASFGVTIEQLDLKLFVNNVTGSDELLWIDTQVGDGRVQRQRPRTLGINMRYNF
ncbi:hypothetical protein BST96_06525 [Oceanicoccus sagamiensis]|uniref:TonB-dependent receptor n=1 Tax=Oceanicoccus sagamiensis TaxID=716816 RepID=A0A1X9N7Y8_9GAMM|nr:hypothetical protein BST96_06525 [Oceanicoccus sagamiensis]